MGFNSGFKGLSGYQEMRHTTFLVEAKGTGCGFDHNMDITDGGRCFSPYSYDFLASREIHFTQNVVTLLRKLYEFLWANVVRVWKNSAYRTG
jgi:hypothetical protein